MTLVIHALLFWISFFHSKIKYKEIYNIITKLTTGIDHMILIM